MESLWNAVRYKVSADKNRYLRGQYDLDLTYITDRIVAMAFPADGMESTYRNKIDDVAQMTKENHGDHFMIYNLSERSYDYGKFNTQVHEWCGFPDHHPPPLAKLFQIVKSMYSWLQADPKNVVIVHCLAGKGRTGTVIAVFFLYSGLFDNVEKALTYFACKRSNNNWGVTNPSQVRYAQYCADILYKNVVPSSKLLQLSYVHMHHLPSFTSSIGAYALGRQGGCCPFINVYNVTYGKKLLYSSETVTEELKSYSAGESVTFPIDCPIKGDILVEVYHVTPFFRTEHMLRLEFHTGMITGNVLHFTRAQLDLACQDKRFSREFFIDLGFQQLTEEEGEKPEEIWWENSPRGNGSICFFDQEKMRETKEMAVINMGKIEKGGWLTKRGHKVKNMKRRWFVLKDPTLCYYKSPRDTTPAGVIILDDILTVVSEKNIYKDNASKSKKPNFWFEIITKKSNYLICADSDQDMRDWVDAIEYVIRSQRQIEENRQSTLEDSDLASIEESVAQIEENLRLLIPPEEDPDLTQDFVFIDQKEEGLASSRENTQEEPQPQT